MAISGAGCYSGMFILFTFWKPVLEMWLRIWDTQKLAQISGWLGWWWCQQMVGVYGHCCVLSGRHWRPAGRSSFSIPRRWITLGWSRLGSSQVVSFVALLIDANVIFLQDLKTSMMSVAHLQIFVHGWKNHDIKTEFKNWIFYYPHDT